MELANTTITIMRGTSVNTYGDATDVGTPHYTGIPAALTETGHTTYDPASQTRRTIRATKCLVPNWVDVVVSDTIQDERTGNFYMIESIEAQPTLGLPADTILTLRSRSGVSVTTD